MIRIPNDIDRYIQDSKTDIRLAQESRKIAAVFPPEKSKNSRKQKENGALSNEDLTDTSFLNVFSDKIQKQKTMDK